MFYGTVLKRYMNAVLMVTDAIRLVEKYISGINYRYVCIIFLSKIRKNRIKAKNIYRITKSTGT